MGFHEVRFPTDISYGSKGGPGFNTNIIETSSGAEQRVQRWDSPRHAYDVVWGIKDLEDVTTVRNFYIARSGCAFGFRYKDFLDYNSSASGIGTVTNLDQQLGIGDASDTTFQLVKRYQNGPSTVIRTITKPVAGTVVIAFDGVNQPSGWSVDTSTGVVTFVSPPGSGVVITCGFEFDVPVRFGKEIDNALWQQIEGFDSGSVDSIPLVEIKDATQIDEDYPYGGQYSLVTSVNASINLINGRLQLVQTTGAGLVISLPDPASLPTGRSLCTVINVGSNSFTIKTHTGTTVVVLAVNQAAELALGVDNSSAKVWYAV